MTLHVCDHTPGQSWTPPAWMIPDLESPGLIVGNSHCHCQWAQICQTTNSQIRVEHKAHNLSSTVVCKAPQKKSTVINDIEIETLYSAHTHDRDQSPSLHSTPSYFKSRWSDNRSGCGVCVDKRSLSLIPLFTMSILRLGVPRPDLGLVSCSPPIEVETNSE